MWRFLAFTCCLAVAAATPAVVKSREEIDAYRAFLERTKTGNGARYLSGAGVSPDVDPKEIGGYFQGDIVLDDWMIENMVEEYATGRAAVIEPDSKWPNNTVAYLIEPYYDDAQIAAIKDAIKDIEQHTCIKFSEMERVVNGTAFVWIRHINPGCWAHIGYSKARGIHRMNLASARPGFGCFAHATIVHEFMHILGFFHMHTTYNRDEYVKILEENIIPAEVYNFVIQSRDKVSNLGLGYEYNSCMHYGARSFSRNGLETIVALKEHNGAIGQRSYVTENDWLRINRHYNCPGAWD